MDYWVQYENIFSIVWLRAHVNEKSNLNNSLKTRHFFKFCLFKCIYIIFFLICAPWIKDVSKEIIYNWPFQCNRWGLKRFLQYMILMSRSQLSRWAAEKKSSCRLLSLKTWSTGTSIGRRGAVTLISRITDIYIQKYEFLLVCESSLDHLMLRHSLTLTAHQFHERFRNCLSISVRPGLSTCNCLFLFDLSILVWPVSQHSKFSYY